MKKPSIIKRYRIILLFITVVVINGAALHLFPKFRFDSIVVHHSASRHGDYASIKTYHFSKSNQVRDAAYHLILSNGSSHVPAGHLEATERYRNLSYSLATKNRRYNLRGLHICIIGNYDISPVPPPMRPAIGHALNALAGTYRISADQILFHRDVGATVCPGRFITRDAIRKWMNEDALDCPANVKAQQQAVIRQAGYSIYTIPRPLLAGMAAFSLLFTTAWVLIAWIAGRRKTKTKHAVNGGDGHT